MPRLQERRDQAAANQNRPLGPGAVRSQDRALTRNPGQALPKADSTRGQAGLRTPLGNRQLATPLQSKPVLETRQQMAQAETRHQTLGSRMNGYLQQRSSVAPDRLRDIRMQTRSDRTVAGIHAERVGRPVPAYVRAPYYDRPDLILHGDHRVDMYYDSYHRLHHRVIWPSYYYPVYYPFGSYDSFHYVWPYYHRKYVFVSLGGWWPDDYCYMRYYWYGWHPYVWYGYYPIAREVAAGDDATYNYYTYNYYTGDGSEAVAQSVQPVGQSTWTEVQQKLEQQKAQPTAQTLADTRFEEGVKSFEGGNYGAAAEKFAEAMGQSPDDVILPFAYAQALFADEHYSKAADVLRNALKKVTPEQEGVFYPRGLYANDDVLYAQIEKLVDKADLNDNDADLQLLLGYHLLGLGETGYAREPLEQAREDPKNAAAAEILLKLLENLESKAGPALKTGAAPAVPSAEAAAPAEAQVPAVPAAEAPAVTATPLSNARTPTEQAAPIGPAEKPADANEQKEKTPPADPSGEAGAQKAVPSEGSVNDNSRSPAPQGDTGPKEVSAALETSAVSGRLPIRLEKSAARGLAGLGLMTLLGCAAVGMQLRHLNDGPTR